MNLTTKALLACTTVLALLGSSAFAATITVEDSYLLGNDLTDTTTAGNVWTVPAATLDLSATSADKLVVGFSLRRIESFTVTYGGISMIPAITRVASSTNDGSAGIFYLDTFGLDGDLVITSSNAATDWNGRTLTAFVLSGTTDGGPVDIDSDNQQVDPTVVSLSTGASGGFVYSVFGINGSHTATVTGGTVGSFATAQSNHAAWNGTTAAAYSVSIANNDSVGVMAAFVPVPEPASLVLLALGGMLIGRRTKK